MPKRMINGCEYFVEEHGTGQETVVLAHGLFMSGRAWHNQVLALRNRYHCIEFDFRGHGRSSSPSGGYDIDSLAGDVIQLMETSGYTPCHLVGCALGGIVAINAALKRPNLIRSLTLINTTATDELAEERRRLWLMSLANRIFGPGMFVRKIMHALFAETFMNDTDRKIQVEHWRNEVRKQNRSGISQSINALARRKSVIEQLGSIRAPTLILAGEEDENFGPAHSMRIHDLVSGSRLLTIANAGHCPPVETPDEVTQALIGFFGSLRAPTRR